MGDASGCLGQRRLHSHGCCQGHTRAGGDAAYGMAAGLCGLWLFGVATQLERFGAEAQARRLLVRPYLARGRQRARRRSRARRGRCRRLVCDVRQRGRTCHERSGTRPMVAQRGLERGGGARRAAARCGARLGDAARRDWRGPLLVRLQSRRALESAEPLLFDAARGGDAARGDDAARRLARAVVRRLVGGRGRAARHWARSRACWASARLVSRRARGGAA